MSHDDVATAILSAKYGESIQITIADEEGEDQYREISLVAVLDAENGGVQWRNADEVESTMGDPDASLRRHLRTKRWFFPMLNDHKRNELYEQAIEAAAKEVMKRVEQRNKSGSPPVQTIQSLDIGSGTGLLAMISTKKLLEQAPNYDINVQSIEMSSAMATIAKETILSNSMEDYIEIQEGHSCEILPLQNKAMLCTSELLESGLLGEGWIPAIRDAWERHLDSDAVIIPKGAKVFAQIVGGMGISNFSIPHEPLDGFPEGRLLSLTLKSDDSNLSSVDSGGGIQKEGIRVPLHVQQLLEDSSSYPIRILSDPIEVLEICVESQDALPPSDGMTRSMTIIPIESGIASGVIYWWELDFFGTTSKYNTGVNESDSHWQDHWQQCLYVFTKESSQDNVVLTKGVPVTLKVDHDDTSISFGVISRDSDARHSSKRIKKTSDEYSHWITPVRAWQLNDLTRSRRIRDSIKMMIEQRGKDVPVLDLSDFSLCGMMAALLGATNVISLEASSTQLLPVATARIAQITNNLPLDGSSFQILRCYAEQLTLPLLGGSQAEIVVAEPYYEILEGWEIQQALNYFYTLKSLKQRNVVKEDAVSVPQKARIMGQVFESMSIAEAYRRCDSPIRGFHHDVANRSYSFHEHHIMLPSWQYKMETLSSPFEIALLDYDSCEIAQTASECVVRLNQHGTCHGMLVWVEYDLPTSTPGIMEVLSTRGRPHNQVIRLLDPPVPINGEDGSVFCCRSNIGRIEGSMDEYTFHISVDKV